MARIRTIKPEFWKHPVLSRLPDDVQLLALALISLCDDYGYFRADAAIVRGEVMPFRENLGKISEGLGKLSEVGWIEIRKSPEGEIGQVLKFSKHQRVHNPTPSKLKTYFDSRSSPEEFPRNSVEPTEEIPQERKGKEQGKEQGTGSVTEESFTLDGAVSYLLIETGLAGRGVRTVVQEVIHRELKHLGAEPKQVADAMIAAWRKYELADLPFKYGPEKFFGNGTWRKPETEWGNGKPVNRAEAAVDQQVANRNTARRALGLDCGPTVIGGGS